MIIPSWENVDGRTSLQILYFYDSESYISHAPSTDMFKWLQKTNLNLERVVTAVPNWKTADGDTLLQLICRSESCVSRVSSKMLECSFKRTNAELLIPNLKWKTADGVPVNKMIQEVINSQRFLFDMVEDLSETLTDVVIIPHWEADDGTIILQVLYRSELYISRLSSVSLSKWLQKTNIDVGEIVIPHWKTADGDTLLQLVCQSELCVSHISSNVMSKWLTDTTHDVIKVMSPHYKTADGDTLLQLACHSESCLSFTSSTVMQKLLNDTTLDLKELITPYYKTADGDSLLQVICQSESCVSHIPAETLKTWLQLTTVDLYIDNLDWKTLDSVTMIEVICHLKSQPLRKIPFGTPIAVVIIPRWENVDGSTSLQILYIYESNISQGSSKDMFKWLQVTNLNLERILTAVPNWKTVEGDTLLQLLCQSESCVSCTSSTILLKLLTNTSFDLELIPPNFKTADGKTLFQLVCQLKSCVIRISSTVMLKWLTDTTHDLMELVALNHETADGDTLLQLICRSESCVSRVSSKMLEYSLKRTNAELLIPNLNWKTADGVPMNEIIPKIINSQRCFIDMAERLNETLTDVVIIPHWETDDGSTILQVLYQSKFYISQFSSVSVFKWLQRTNIDVGKIVIPHWKTADDNTLLQLVCQSESCVSRISSNVMTKWLADTTHDVIKVMSPQYKTADGDTLLQLACHSESCLSFTSSTVMKKLLNDTTLDLKELITPYYKTADGDSLLQLVCQSESCVSRTPAETLKTWLKSTTVDLYIDNLDWKTSDSVTMIEVINNLESQPLGKIYLSTPIAVVMIPDWENVDGSTSLQILYFYDSESYMSQASSTNMFKWLQKTSLNLERIVTAVPNWKTTDGDTLLQLVCQSESCVSRISSKMLEYFFKNTNADLLIPSLNWMTADGDRMIKIVQNSIKSLQSIFHTDEHLSETLTDVVITPHWETDDGSIILQVLYQSEIYCSLLSSISVFKWLQRTNIDVSKIVVPHWTTADGDTLLQLVCQSESCVSRISSTVSPSDCLLDLVFHSEYLISQITSQVILNWLNSTKYTLVGTIVSSWKTKNGDSIFKLLCTSHICFSHISSSLMLQWLNDVDKATFNILKSVHPDWTTSDGDAILHLLCKSSMKENKVVELLKNYLQPSILNPNLTDSDGNTAIHLACKADKPDVVTFLLTNMEWNLNVRNHTGFSALEMTKNPETILCICQYDYVEISSKAVKRWLNDTALIDEEEIVKIFDLLICQHKV